MGNKAKVAALGAGIDYQTLWFWWCACDVVDPFEDAESVAIENDLLPHFDDVVVRYCDGQTAKDGNRLTHDFYQSKLPVTLGNPIGFEYLISSEPFGSGKLSIMERLGEAIKIADDIGIDPRFTFICPYGFKDDMMEFVSSHGEQIKFSKLLKSRTRAHKELVKTICAQLGFSDLNMLRRLESRLRLFSFTDLRLQSMLNQKLTARRFVPVPLELEGNIYTSIGRSLIKSHDARFYSSEDIDLLVSKHELRQPPGMEKKEFGIRTWEFGTEWYPGRFGEMFLDLTENFDGRVLIKGTWNEIEDKIIDCRNTLANPDCQYDLYLDTNYSTAFLAGIYLVPKSNIITTIMQRTHSGTFGWSPNIKTKGSYESITEQFIPNVGENNKDKHAMVISLTRNILGDVQAYLRSNKIPAKILHIFLPSGSSSHSINDGYHAKMLAGQIRSLIKSYDFTGHIFQIFLAAPIAFAFYLGGEIKGLGTITIYEYGLSSDEKYHEGITIKQN